MLSFLGKLYGGVMNARNRLYDNGVLETFDLGAHTISVGNITTGGTGKTPLVAYIAELLAERGEMVCILTRGYGRRDPTRRVLVSNMKEIVAEQDEAGDEPYELAAKLLGRALVIADADRVSAAEWAKRKFGVTVFVLDDGFQHRRAKRDIDIVCIDATNPFGCGRMLPDGRLREPPANLNRADVIVITRSDLVAEDVIEDLRSQISTIAPDAQLFAAANDVKILEKDGCEAKIAGRRAFAFCGIGNPQAFFDQLGRQQVIIAGTRTFKDHHRYTPADMLSIQDEAREAGADVLLTTAKDAVKLTELNFEMPYLVAAIETKIDNAEAFGSLLVAEK